MKNRINKFLLLISPLGAGVFFSCNKEEPIPSYIRIDNIYLTTNYSVQGSNSSKILDAWIYVDDQLIGGFEMPCTVPVLAEGSHEIKIRAGIKENGIAETRIYYPFYEIITQTVTLTRGQITTLNPTTTYSQFADFTWLEDFTSASPSICDTVNSDTVIKQTTVPSEVFEGTGSGVVVLGSGTTGYIGVSCNKYALPKDGSPVFLEMNYNCNTEFSVGIVGYTSNNTLDVQWTSLTLNPTSGWNKVYVNLTNSIAVGTNSTKFGIFFSMAKDANLSTSYFYLDNVKLVN